MNKVPFFDHRPLHNSIKVELSSALLAILESDSLVLGSEVLCFENHFANYVNSKFGIGVNSGLDALVIALRSLDIGVNDEVIVPSNTYIATWQAVSMLGAKPIPVEPKLTTYNIDPNKIEEAITSKTKAIIVVHLYGLPCEMNSIMELANKYNLKVVEDNAQALGAEVNGQKTGSIGHINATSFYPTKNLGALGDAGMISTNDEALFLKCKSLRNYGSSSRGYNEYLGYNSRLDEIHAAILTIKLKYLEKWNAEKLILANSYNEVLTGFEEIITPTQEKNHTYHIYAIRSKYRNQLITEFANHNIDTLIHYPIPPHLQSCYKYLGYKKGDFPIAEEIAESVLSLPIYIGMKGQEKVIDVLSNFIKKI